MTDSPQQVLRRYYQELWVEGNVDALDELLAPDYRDHDPWIGHPAADGHRLRLRGADLVRVIEGRITDIHHVENVLATLRQIGM